jgi:hypothetical protein
MDLPGIVLMFNLSESYASFDHHIIIYRISKTFIFINSLSNELDIPM